MTRFTRFSLEIRKTILFSFRVFSKKSKKRIKRRTEGSISRTLEAATTGTPVDTLRALVEFCWQLLTHKSHSQVRSILAIKSHSQVRSILAIQLGYEPCLKELLAETNQRMENNPYVAAENATEGEGMQNTPIADNIAVERTEAAAESAAEGAEIFTEVTPEMWRPQIL